MSNIPPRYRFPWEHEDGQLSREEIERRLTALRDLQALQHPGMAVLIDFFGQLRSSYASELLYKRGTSVEETESIRANVDAMAKVIDALAGGEGSLVEHYYEQLLEGVIEMADANAAEQQSQ